MRYRRVRIFDTRCCPLKRAFCFLQEANQGIGQCVQGTTFSKYVVPWRVRAGSNGVIPVMFSPEPHPLALPDTRTRTRTNTNPNDTEANAAGRSVRACVRPSDSYGHRAVLPDTLRSVATAENKERRRRRQDPPPRRSLPRRSHR